MEKDIMKHQEETGSISHKHKLLKYLFCFFGWF